MIKNDHGLLVAHQGAAEATTANRQRQGRRRQRCAIYRGNRSQHLHGAGRPMSGRPQGTRAYTLSVRPPFTLRGGTAHMLCVFDWHCTYVHPVPLRARAHCCHTRIMTTRSRAARPTGTVLHVRANQRALSTTRPDYSLSTLRARRSRHAVSKHSAGAP